MDGIVSVVKPAGMSSSEAVSIFRRAAGMKKVGHLGTLDPAAAGVMVLLLGRATRLFDLISEGEKEYVAVFTFGTETDTLDQEGTVTRTLPYEPDENALRAALPAFTGEIVQIPPIYSAVTMGGERLYHMARRGAVAEIPSRTVTVRELELLELSGNDAKFRIACSKGTYIRSLCRDLAEALGTCGYVSYLLRTRSGDTRLEDCMTLYEAAALAAKGELEDRLTSMEDALSFLPAYTVPSSKRRAFANGGKLTKDNFPEGPYCRLYSGGAFAGVGKIEETETGRVMRFDLHLETEHADT